MGSVPPSVMTELLSVRELDVSVKASVFVPSSVEESPAEMSSVMPVLAPQPDNKKVREDTSQKITR